MTILHLIRHGQTNWNAEGRVQGQSDSQLDATGREQATALRPLIETLSINAIYSSSSLRTRQTTDILAQNLALETNLRDDLREIQLGPWETQLWEDIYQQDPQDVDLFRNNPAEFSRPGCETFAQLRDRGVQALKSIAASESDANVLVVSHGALLKATLSHFAGVPLSELRNIPAFDNCSRSVLTFDDDSHTVVSVGGTAFAETAWADYKE